QVTGIDLRLLRGGVISGNVRTQSGRPAAGVTVQVMQVQTVNGVRQMSSSMTALMALANGPITTDDRGVYRAYGLPPGEYLVQTQTDSLGSIPSLLPGTRQVTAAEVQWAQQATSQAPG